MSIPTASLWLDLDGTVREGVDDPLGRFVNSPADVRVFPEALAAMKAWLGAHPQGRIFGITNQGGVALGHFTPDQMLATLEETQRQADGLFDTIMVCVHHPDAPDPENTECWCRKPRIGLIVEGAIRFGEATDEHYPPSMSLFVGDLDTDRQCAEAAGIPFVWAADWRAGATAPAPGPPPCPDHHETQHRDGKPPWCNRCGWRHAVPAVPAMQVGVPRDERPHSRACGITAHDHGGACAADCPTCRKDRA